MKIRDIRPEDFPRVREIHEATGIEYDFPDLSSPLFVVTQVIEDDNGVVQVCGGLYLQCEAYLWASADNWASPEDKLAAISALDGSVMHSAWLRGLDCCVIWLPPGMDRFGERLVQQLGFTRDRNNWISYSKKLTC